MTRHCNFWEKSVPSYPKKVIVSAPTIFLAEDKDEVSRTVFEICIQMSHETDQATLHCGAFLWPLRCIFQRRQNLMKGIGSVFMFEKKKNTGYKQHLIS